MKVFVKSAAVAAFLSSAAGFASAGVIYTDNFTGTAGTAIGGAAPTTANGVDGGNAAATWKAATVAGSTTDVNGNASGIWQYNGSGSAAISSAAATSGGFDNALLANAYLPFAPTAGLTYKLSLSVTTSGANTGNWIGLGFFQSTLNGHLASGNGPSNNGVYGLTLNSANGGYQRFSGVGTNGPASTNGTTSPAGTLVAGSTHTFNIVLDYTATPTFSWSVDSGAFSTPVTSATGSPGTEIGYVGFGTNKINGSVTAFSLTSTPEPTSLAALAGGAALLSARRRRS